MVRPLEEQFDPETASQIRVVLSTLRKIRYPDGASRYYAVELQHVLEAGALLGALSLACTLLEAVVRGLVLERSAAVARPRLNLERELEAKRHLGFSDLVDALGDADLFDVTDVDRAKELYRTVRIPVHHALSQRFVRFKNDAWWFDLHAFLGRSRSVSSHDLEEVVEDHALEHIQEIATIIQRNSGQLSPRTALQE